MHHIRWSAVLLGWALCLGAAAGVLVTSTGPLLSAVGTASSGPDTAIAAAATLAAWVVLAWLALGVMVGLLETLIRSVSHAGGAQLTRMVRAVAPAFVRRAVQTSLRAGLVAGAVGSSVVGPSAAFAVPCLPVVHPVDDPRPADWPVLDRPAHPLHLASPSTTPSTIDATRRAESGSHRPLQYLVRPGDSLWTIAADHLPRGASESEIAHSWPRWWRVNRQVVGDDPDLIRPGQLLRVPEVLS